MSATSLGGGADIASAGSLGDLAGIVAHPDLMVPDLESDSKIGAIKQLVDRLHQRHLIDDSLGFLQAVLERENLQSTVIADGQIALPHARGRMVRRLGLALGRTRQPIAFPSGDDRHEVDLICLIAVPADAPGQYLRLLAVLARAFGDTGFRDRLATAQAADEMQALLAARLEACAS